MSDGSTAAPHGTAGQRRLGLPESGPGSAAGFGRRLAALAVDGVLAALVAAVFTRPEPPGLWSSVVLVLSYTFFTGVYGQTPGMRLLGIGVVRVANGRPLGLPRAALRALLLQLLLPAVVMDADGRGWHDRAVGSVVVRG
jgi:uncharacterized RDD family membrane protein YckC